MTSTFVSAERQARFDALEDFSVQPSSYIQFSPADAVVAEELRTGMLAFINEPSIDLASKFTSTLEALEGLVSAYPPIGFHKFLYEVVGCSKFDLSPPSNPGVYTFVDKCYNDSYPETNVLDYCGDLFDDKLFYKQLSDPRHPIRPDWNGNFQVYILEGLFKAYVSKFRAGYPCLLKIIFGTVDVSYLLDDTPYTCGLYVGFLDPDYCVRHILSDLVAPENQLEGCKYVFSKDDTDIERFSFWDRDENWCIEGNPYLYAVVIMQYSDLVPPGYGLPLSSVEDMYHYSYIHHNNI